MNEQYEKEIEKNKRKIEKNEITIKKNDQYLNWKLLTNNDSNETIGKKQKNKEKV
jgi:hypothetical protein